MRQATQTGQATGHGGFAPATPRHPSSRLVADCEATARHLGLSHRERQIAQGILDGLTEVGIGRWLGISRHTVHTHIRRIYGKIGVNSRCEFVIQLLAVCMEEQPRDGTRDEPIAYQGDA